MPKHFAARYQQLVSALALIVIQNFRKWLDKIKPLIEVFRGINRPPLFTGENYPFWKVRMQIFLESVDRGIWDTVVNGPFVPVNVVNDVQEPKPFSQWTADENS